MTQYLLNDSKKSKLIVAALWFIYAASYFIRTCYAASIAAIVSDGTFNKSSIGLVGTSFFICYATGQLISGLLGDRVNPFFMIIFGAVSGSLCCFLMPAAKSIGFMILIWGANGFFQSMLWSPILRIFSETIDKRLQKKAILNISLSLPVGTILAYLSSTILLKHYSWQHVFVCGGMVFLSAALFIITVTISVKNGIEVKPVLTDKRINTPIKSDEKNSIFTLGLLSGLFIIMLPSFLHGMMRDVITNWVPTMISEIYGISPSFSVFLTIALPILNAFGAYAAVPLYKKFGENEMKTAGVFAMLSLAPLLLLIFIGKLSVYIIIILLALTTSIMYALNYLIISLVPVHFAGSSKTSSVSGILNSAAHIGCALSSYGFGAVSEKFGWKAVIVIWIISAFLTSLFSFLGDRKWSVFIKSN